MPVDRGAIDAQLKEIGEGEHWWEHPEFRALPHVLRAEERIRGIVLGRVSVSRARRLRMRARWLLLVTDDRLVGLKQERYARKQIDIPRDQIALLTHGPRVRHYRINIHTAHVRYRIRISKADAARFTAALAPLVPSHALPRLSPEVEAFAWIPGMTTVATMPGFSGIVSRVSKLAPPPPAEAGRVDALEAAVDRLQADVERLQQQVEFLEDLLQKRSDEAFLQRTSSGS